MSWNVTEKELKIIKLENPKLYQQMLPQDEIIKEVEKGNKVNDNVILQRVNYADWWASQHPTLAKWIKILLDLGGYDDTTLESNK